MWFWGPFVILRRGYHARLVADIVRVRSELIDMQCRALEAERQVSELTRRCGRLETVAATLETVNEEMREQIRLDEALMGFGAGE